MFFSPANLRNPLSSTSNVLKECGQSPIPCHGSCKVVTCGRGERYLFLKIWVSLSLKYPDRFTVSNFPLVVACQLYNDSDRLSPLESETALI